MKYVFIIIIIFIIIFLSMNPQHHISERLSPIKEGYKLLINNITNDRGTYTRESTQTQGNDNGFFAQPGKLNANGNMSITQRGGIPSRSVAVEGSNVQTKFNQNKLAVDSNAKTGEYIQAPQFYTNAEIENPKPPGLFNDIYSRSRECSKKGQLACAVENLENPYSIPTYTIDEQNRQFPNTPLYGGQNPKTLIPPMVTRPMYSLDWRNNSLVVPNIINGTTNENLYLSGYLSKNDISTWDDEERMRGVSLTRDAEGEIVENYSPAQYSPAQYSPAQYSPAQYSPEDSPASQMPEKIRASQARPQQIMNPRGNPRDYIVENYNIDNPARAEYKEKDWSDMVNMSNGYNKGQFPRNNFPNNLPQGNCGQNEKLKEYNDRLFTSTIQPGTFYKQDVVEQVNGNAGISFQQQFLPRTIKEVSGGTLYEDHDPETYPVLPEIFQEIEPSIDNIYDPRFNGYGDQTRTYVDDVTGQPRFVYDDINNVKMPNYITRNKLDTFNFGSRYGVAEPHGKSLNDIRGRAEAAFLENSISHRDDMTVKLMRKSNAAEWQRRSAPIRTNLR